MLARGVDMLWYPVGWTAGYLVLLLFVAAPLRRSGAYTLPDFAELRVESRHARSVASGLVVLIGVLYLVPQFQGAGLTLRTLTGAPAWVGAAVVALVVLVNVVSGGMRSITLVQAVQYWLKLCALLLPLAFLLVRTHGHAPAGRSRLDATDWLEPMQGPYSLYLTYSLILATFLGTMGLPHVVVRFYTNRDGRAARRTTRHRAGPARRLLPAAAVVRRPRAGSTSRELIGSGRADSVVLALPGSALGGLAGDLLTAAARRGGVRGVPVDLLGPGRLDRRRDRPGRAGPLVRAGPGVPAGRRARRPGHLRPGAALLRPRGRPRGRARVRGGRLDVLPAAAARHLVAGPDRPGRRRRHAPRRRCSPPARSG